MHRIDTPTAQIDKFGQGKNGFTNGDPSNGRRATDLNSDMWDAVQEEIANAIESTGIALDKSKHNQLYLAIQKAITDPGFLKKANNLSDLEDVAEARGNLQLGTASTKNVGVSGGNVMQVGAFGLGVGPQSKNDAYNSVAEFYRVNATSANKPPITGNIAAGVVSLPCDSAPSTGYVSVSGNGAAFIGSSNAPANGVKWSRIYTTDYKPTAQDTGALPITGGTLTGQLSINHADFINKNGYTTYTDGDGKLHRQAGGLRLTIADTILAELYYNETAGISAEVSLHNKYGSTDSYFSLRNDGQFSVIGASPQVILSNGTIFATDGNVKGSVWDNGYLSNWILSKANAAKDAAIDWANTNCARKPTSWLQPTGWFRDATTGLITQWGIVTRGGDSTRVWFPSAFPNACVNVQLTLRNSNSGGSSSNVFANSEDGQGFNYISGSNEVQSFWLAKGY
ncbi:gp53-like domain-containing protein [Serratia proteamaculans]